MVRNQKLCSDTLDSSEYQEVIIKKESHEVALSNVETNSPVPCGKKAH